MDKMSRGLAHWPPVVALAWLLTVLLLGPYDVDGASIVTEAIAFIDQDQIQVNTDSTVWEILRVP